MPGRVDPLPIGRWASSQPPAQAATIYVADTVHTRGPSARRTAAHSAPSCPTASASSLPAGARRSHFPPVLTWRSSRANVARIVSACAANRKSSQDATHQPDRRAEDDLTPVDATDPCPLNNAAPCSITTGM
jgi:hypothetical protein